MMAEIDTTYSTIASMLPYDLVEPKPGLNPNEYIVKGKGKNELGLTIIPNNVFYRVNTDPLADVGEVRYVNVPVPSMELAQSIINDYVNALLAVAQPDTVPGLFAIPGNYSDIKIVTLKFQNEIKTYREAQNRWFRELVNIADDTWAKTKSPLGISELQRHAAEALQLKRDWLNPVLEETLSKCPICQSAINPGALKCLACGTVLNKKAYEEVLAGIK